MYKDVQRCTDLEMDECEHEILGDIVYIVYNLIVNIV